ncbi:MAG: nucleotidyltransferase domain-containing protein [Planctomycetes bacterium]|nr:nucleotidyltransferase domain-containing protein [Planctomycetota bacterium]
MQRVSRGSLEGLVNAIVREIGPEEIILFGSLARGDDTVASDVDLMVVEREAFGPGRSRRRVTSRIREALWEFRVPLDILVFSRDEVERWRNSLNHVIGRASREGKVLYARH